MTLQKGKSGYNSEFVRSKLELDYNPIVLLKKDYYIVSDKPARNRHWSMSKEESEICDRAVKSIRQGSEIRIDWNTKSNFRTTKSISLPKVHIEPERDQNGLIQTKRSRLLELLKLKSSKEHKYKNKSLLFQSQQERYNSTRKRISQGNKPRLFFSTRKVSVHPNEGESSKTEPLNKLSNSHLTELKRSIRTEKTIKIPVQPIEKVQQELISKSKLRILQSELQAKFQQIRQMYKRQQQ